MAKNNRFPGARYSANVSIYVDAPGQRIELAGVSGNQCTLRHATQIPPCSADLVIVIDGNVKRSRVLFPEGIIGGPFEDIECVEQ